MPDDKHPGEDFPPECRQWMERTMDCAAAGDIPGCLEMQRRANDCLRAHGQHTLDMPEEYFVLMHQSIAAARRGDMAEAQRLGGRMEQVIALSDFDGIPGMPEECKDLLRRSNEAEDRGDMRENILLAKAYNQCLIKHGLLDTHMPDEFFDLQLQALDAQERGDQQEYARLMAEIMLFMQAHGMEEGPDATA